MAALPASSSRSRQTDGLACQGRRRFFLNRTRPRCRIPTCGVTGSQTRSDRRLRDRIERHAAPADRITPLFPGVPSFPAHAVSPFEILDPRFNRFVLSHALPERIADGCRWTEGPVWFGDGNFLLFSDIPSNRILRWSENAGMSVFRQPSGFANGNTRDRQGRLVSCLHGARAVVRTEHDGRRTVLADRFEGRRLNSPNDVVVKSDGSIWFTDPHYGIAMDYEGEGRAEEELPCLVYRLDPHGRLDMVSDAFACPNGICFSPDERTLYVAETGRVDDNAVTRQVVAFAVDESGGRIRLGSGRPFYAPAVGHADGFRCDEHGNLWCSAGDGVHCVDPDGTLLGRIRLPQTVSNVAFGGRHRSRLFICATREVYAVHLNVRGAA